MPEPRADRKTSDERSVSVFISYRRNDNRHFVGRLYDKLKDEFGSDHVFRDIDSLYAGSLFAEVIEQQLAQVDVVLAVIGRGWLDGRLANPGDFVRIELEAALEQDVLVIPVLIDDTPLPTTSELPTELQRLPDFNVARVHDESFESDLRRLIRDLPVAVGAHAARSERAAELAARAELERSLMEATTKESARLAEAIRLADEEAASARSFQEQLRSGDQQQVARQRAELDAVHRRRTEAVAAAEAAAAEQARLRVDLDHYGATGDAISPPPPQQQQQPHAQRSARLSSRRTTVFAVAGALALVALVIVWIVRPTSEAEAARVVEELLGHREDCQLSEGYTSGTFGEQSSSSKVSCGNEVEYYVFASTADLATAFESSSGEAQANGDCSAPATWNVSGAWERGSVMCYSPTTEANWVIWTYDDEHVLARFITGSDSDAARELWLGRR